MSGYKPEVPVNRMYDPRKVLMLMNPDEGLSAQMLSAQLACRGMTVLMVSDETDAAALVNKGYDVLITGPGYDHFADRVKNDPSLRGIHTVAVSQNGVLPDVKLGSLDELSRYAGTQWITEHYRANKSAQEKRREEDIGHLADLEITLMNAQAN